MRLDKITLVAALVITLSAAAQAPNTALAVPETSPKRAGTVRIGVVEPEAAQFSATVRMALIEHLSTPGVDVLPLRSRNTQTVEAEATSKDCDFILYTSVHGTGAGPNFAYRLYAAGGGIPVVAQTYQFRAATVAGGAVTEGAASRIPEAWVQKAAGEVLGAVISRGHFHDEDAKLGTRSTAVRWPQL